MKQMIIGIYDGGYDYSINFLDIKDNKVESECYTRYDIEHIKDISNKLKSLGDKIYYNYDGTLKDYLRYNYKDNVDFIIIVEDGWMEIIE